MSEKGTEADKGGGSPAQIAPDTEAPETQRNLVTKEVDEKDITPKFKGEDATQKGLKVKVQQDGQEVTNLYKSQMSAKAPPQKPQKPP